MSARAAYIGMSLALLAPGTGAAQYLASRRMAELAPIDTLKPHSVGAMALGGTFLGLGGFLAGGAIGGYLIPCSGDLCNLSPAAVGALVGETFGMALGVHAVNGHRGKLGLDWLAALGTAGVGIAIAGAASPHRPIPTAWFAAIPVMQLAATIAVERGTQTPDSGTEIGVVAQPLGRGRTALGLSVKF